MHAIVRMGVVDYDCLGFFNVETRQAERYST